MNLTFFLEKVDQACDERNKAQLAAFIRQRARILPEDQRTAFLNQLNGKEEQAVRILSGSDISRETITDALAELAQIAEGNVCLTGRLNEEYDDWYGEGDEFLFEDPCGIGKFIEEATDLAHQCVDAGEYEGAFSIGSALMNLQIKVGGEYADYSDEAMTLSSMKENELTGCNLRRLVTETLYAAINNVPPEERPDVLYHLFEQSPEEVRFEDVVQSGGRELPDWKAFLLSWTAYLGKTEGRLAQRLYEEAVLLLNDWDASVRAAAQYVGLHPGLYEKLLQRARDAGDHSGMLVLGREALEKIPVDLAVRSRAALLTAESALHMGEQAMAEQCWLEAFRSDPFPPNYLRLFTECRDFSQYRSSTEEIIRAWENSEKRSWSRFIYENDEMAESDMSNSDFCSLLFFSGAFRKSVENGMNTDKPLGWSSTFMKQGITLFLLYLYRGDKLGSGLNWLCSRAAAGMAFTAEGYCCGPLRSPEESDTDLFWERFRVWREQTPMEEAFQEEMLKRLNGWTALRTQGIMGGNHRKYYKECAASIAALGEVRESRGERGAKQTVLMEYRAEYSRRTAFHQEMRDFGMRDGKRR